MSADPLFRGNPAVYERPKEKDEEERKKQEEDDFYVKLYSEGLSLYGYVKENPVNLVDKIGHDSFKAIQFDKIMSGFLMEQLKHPRSSDVTNLCDIANCSSTVNMTMALANGILPSKYNNMKDILKALNENLNIDKHLQKTQCGGWASEGRLIESSANPRLNPSEAISKLSGKSVIYDAFTSHEAALEYIKKNPGKVIKATLSREGASSGHNTNFHWVGLYYNPESKQIMVLDPLVKKPYAISEPNPKSFHNYIIPKMTEYRGKNIRIGTAPMFYLKEIPKRER